MTPELSPQRNQERESSYAAIVVMTYSSNLKSQSSDLRLSYWSAQSIHAAYHLYKNGTVPQIIIPGETIFGSDKATTAQLMTRYLLNKNVPPNAISQLHDLNNT